MITVLFTKPSSLMKKPNAKKINSDHCKKGQKEPNIFFADPPFPKLSQNHT